MRPTGGVSPDTRAVVAYEEPECQECILILACPLFPSAAREFRSFGLPCHAAPATEQRKWLKGQRRMVVLSDSSIRHMRKAPVPLPVVPFPLTAS